MATAILLLLLVLVGHIVTGETSVLGQEASKTSKPPIEEFEKYLSNSILSGSFTMDGQPLNKLEEERYEIKSAKKLEGDDNLWEIKTRIKYGNKDLTVPVVVNLEWVGRTPMIVLDSVTIPGLGTFSARVVFHDRKYAGTWKHDNVGGHLSVASSQQLMRPS
ncbi:MAG: hypothetical protein ACKOAU_21880, partial [Pirellula sp.]